METRCVGSWAETGDLEKLIFGLRAIKTLAGSHAYAFTADLNPAVADRASDDPDWLRRLLVRHVGPQTPLVMAYGANDGRLHLHGAFAATGTDDYARIVVGIEAAAGQWAAQRGGQHQFHYEVLGAKASCDGWARYLLRNIAEASAVTDAGPLWSMTNAARRPAKAMHAALRERVNGERA